MAKHKRKPMRRPKKNRTDRSELLQTLLIINAILATVKTILEIIENCPSKPREEILLPLIITDTRRHCQAL